MVRARDYYDNFPTKREPWGYCGAIILRFSYKHGAMTLRLVTMGGTHAATSLPNPPLNPTSFFICRARGSIFAPPHPAPGEGGGLGVNTQG